MEKSRIDLLTERQREVLRLRSRRLRVKEIAAEIGVSGNTASGYLTEAATLLGVGRDGAVRLLMEWEATHPESRGRFSVGDSAASQPPVPPPAAAQAEPTTPWRALLPLRSGAQNNELSITARLLWIVALALGGAVGFGMLANGARVVGDLFVALRGR